LILSQPSHVSTGNSLVSAIEDSQSVIERLESQQGAYGQDLSQELLSLGLTYQRNNKHEEAITALKRALHLKRINDGLYSTTQIPIIKKIIHSLSVTNKWALVDHRYAYLKWLYAQNYAPQAIETLHINLLMAKWHLKSYSLKLLDKPIIDLINSYSAYEKALSFIKKHFGETDSRLLGTLEDISLVNYLIATAEVPGDSTYVMNNRGMSSQSTAFSSSSQSYSAIPLKIEESPATQKIKYLKKISFKSGLSFIEKELEIYQKQNKVNHLEVTKIKLKLADWYLLYGKQGSAMSRYQQAYLYLKENVKSSDILDDTLSQPVVLPDFPAMRKNVSTIAPIKQLQKNDNYVHASMDITRFGKAKNIEIVSVSSENKSISRKVMKSLKDAQFRPKFTDGNFILTEKIQLHLFL